jgi:hypothetical protein
MAENTTEQRLNELLERERTIIKKMNVALRAGANPQVIGHFDFMLQEVRFAQQDLRQLQKSDKSDGFDDYLSIG